MKDGRLHLIVWIIGGKESELESVLFINPPQGERPTKRHSDINPGQALQRRQSRQSLWREACLESIKRTACFDEGALRMRDT